MFDNLIIFKDVLGEGFGVSEFLHLSWREQDLGFDTKSEMVVGHDRGWRARRERCVRYKVRSGGVIYLSS